MQLNTGTLADSGDTLAQAGSVMEKAARIERSKSLLGHAATALTLGARFAPVARRLVKRNPALGVILIAATIGALVVVYSRRLRAQRSSP